MYPHLSHPKPVFFALQVCQGVRRDGFVLTILRSIKPSYSYFSGKESEAQ